MTLNNTTTGGTYYVLQKKTITTTYNGNNVTSGSTASQSWTMYNASTTCAITLNANGYTRTNYTFEGSQTLIKYDDSTCTSMNWLYSGDAYWTITLQTNLVMVAFLLDYDSRVAPG